MSIKNDIVLAHIKDFSPGTKISVRKLSTELDISEGTVYKAIKQAEAQGLVVTKPKVGTVRIDSGFESSAEPLSLKKIAMVLGLSVIRPAQNQEQNIDRIVICDGDEEHLRNNLSDCAKNNVSTLCLVGNRPDMQKLILQLGAHLLITGGMSSSSYLLHLAEEHGLCIMASLQDSYTVSRLLYEHMSPKVQPQAKVSNWMQTPAFLYNNDVVADWQHLYESSNVFVHSYPVVLENHLLCGKLELGKAFASNPSQRISGLLSNTQSLITVNEETAMHDVALEMILTGQSIAVVTRENEMVGLVCARDLLRYFLYSAGTSAYAGFESYLELEPESESGERLFFRVNPPQDATENYTSNQLALMYAAAKGHARKLLGAEVSPENATFFKSRDAESDANITLACTVTQLSDKHCTLEVETFDNYRSYCKAIFMFSANQ